MWVVIVALLLVIIALLVVAVVIVKSITTRKKQSSLPILNIKATITNCRDEVKRTNMSGFQSVDESQNFNTRSYYIDFRLLDGQIKTFKVNKKVFSDLTSGSTGTLTFQGDKFIRFDSESSHTAFEPVKKGVYFFQKPSKTGPTVKFYVDAPGLNLSIFSDKAIDCDYEEVCLYVDRMLDNNTDNFFVLENSKGDVLQFYNNGRDHEIEIEVPNADSITAYRRNVQTIHAVKDCLKAYFEGVDIIKYCGLVKETI